MMIGRDIDTLSLFLVHGPDSLDRELCGVMDDRFENEGTPATVKVVVVVSQAADRASPG